MSLLIVGSVAYDNIKTPFNAKDDVLGGSATYSSLAASYFTKPSIIAVIGEDFSQSDKAVLSSHNVNLDGLETAPGKTFRWGGEYSFDLNSRTTLFTELNVFEQFNPKISATQATSKNLFLGNMHPVLQKTVLNQMQQPQFIALDTMNYWIESAKPELLEVLKLINCIIINESEARELTEEHNIVKAAAAIKQFMDAKKNPLIIIKRGEYGILMFQDKNSFFLPAYPLEEVLDPTGAGDSFAGGFMGYIAKQPELQWETYKKACVTGSCLASFCVEKMGTERLQTLTDEDISSRMQAFEKFTTFRIS